MNLADRQTAALNCLNGLATGDAFGECFFSIALNPQSHLQYFETRTLPNWRWRWTDDTAMTLSIVEVLMKHGAIDQDALADAFARRYGEDDSRGYGGAAHEILRSIRHGVDWRIAAQAVFGGAGSLGNGGAMRAAPIGAYFSDDLAAVVEQARASAEVTHAHLDGQAGAIAVAVAAALMRAKSDSAFAREDYFQILLERTPPSQTREGIERARALPASADLVAAVKLLGNGARVTAPDTVPLCVWCAANHSASFVDAMWETARAAGDVDTNCAIVAGIICANAHVQPPEDWLAHREPLPAFR